MNPLIGIILKIVAAKAVPELERLAAEVFLKHGGRLREKGELGIDLVMREYKQMSSGIAVLAATEIDDLLLRQLAGAALKTAFDRADERVKQAAREVESVVYDAVTYTPAPSAGVPMRDEDFAPSMAVEPPGRERD